MRRIKVKAFHVPIGGGCYTVTTRYGSMCWKNVLPHALYNMTGAIVIYERESRKNEK